MADTSPSDSGPVATPIALFSIFAPLATLAVVLRFYSRHLKGVPWQADDWMIIPALFFALAQGIILVINACIGDLGKHQPLNSEGKAILSPKLEVFQIFEYASFITFVLALAFAKLSILHLYLRIFDLQRSFQVTVWVTYGINVAWSICFFWGYVFKCNPIPDYWETANLTGRCLPNSFNYAFAFSNVILDAIILVLPLPMVWSLNMKWRQKVIISCVFLLGSFVVMLSIAKAVAFFVTLHWVQTDNDITYDEAPLFYFSVPEALFAVTSACLPTLRPVMRHWRVPMTSPMSQNRYYHPSSGSNALGSLRGHELPNRHHTPASAAAAAAVTLRDQHPAASAGLHPEKPSGHQSDAKSPNLAWNEWYSRRWSPDHGRDPHFAKPEYRWGRESVAPTLSNAEVASTSSTLADEDSRLLAAHHCTSMLGRISKLSDYSSVEQLSPDPTAPTAPQSARRSPALAKPAAAHVNGVDVEERRFASADA